jgi:hypothetical protein
MGVISKIEFRKVPDEEKMLKFGALLKLYQQEIDRLSKRSIFAENAFSNLTNLLSQPNLDPLPVLEENQVTSHFKNSGLLVFIPFFWLDFERTTSKREKPLARTK